MPYDNDGKKTRKQKKAYKKVAKGMKKYKKRAGKITGGALAQILSNAAKDGKSKDAYNAPREDTSEDNTKKKKNSKSY
jgi:hypothetical protein